MREAKRTHADKGRVNRGFSGPLFRYTCKSNLILMLVITAVFCMFTGVTNVAASLMTVEETGTIDEESQEDFFRYLGVLAVYDQQTGGSLSYEDFASGGDRDAYEAAFTAYNNSPSAEAALSADDFADCIAAIEEEGADPAAYVKLFEYAFAMQGQKGVFSGEELELSGMVE